MIYFSPVYRFFPADYTISVNMITTSILVHYTIYFYNSPIIFDKLKLEAV